jgi:hypothetical protein
MKINHWWTSNRSQHRIGALAGALIALIVSILHSQAFRLDVWGATDLIAWYLLSLLTGGFSGLAGSLLVSAIPGRLPSAVEYCAGALLGLLGYVFQVYVFLRIAFTMVSWE